MLQQVKVKYAINTKVQWHMWDKEYTVIWYEYIHKRWIRYILLWEEDSRKHCYDFEIKWKKSDKSIWFTL